MPAMVNGIGTHYYGKKNAHSRRDICHSCHRPAELVSYDTREWFVVFFIPVIPLQRKRITDECQVCQRHYVMPLEQWEKHKQQSIAQTVDSFRGNPSIETALETHAAVVGFRQFDDAAKFRAVVLDLLGENDQLLSGFADHLDQMDRTDEATPYYERLLALQPENPQAKFGVAFRKANAGQLDDARKLLDFLMQPGAATQYPLQILNFLAGRYHDTGNSEAAMQIYDHLLRELPQLGQDSAFRKSVRKAEKAVHREDSMLPQRSSSWLQTINPWHPGFSPVALGAAVLILFAAGFAGRNEYLRNHRTLHVISGLPEAWTVQVDDQPPVTPSPLVKVVVAEGRHRIKVAGPQPFEENIEMQTTYWQRLRNRPAWVYNVKKSGVLVETQVHYADNPRGPDHKIEMNRSLNYFEHIDYPFEEPPDTVEASAKKNEVILTTLAVFPLAPAESVALHLKDNRLDDAMDLAEAHLSSSPAEEYLALIYAKLAEDDPAKSRALNFLKARIEDLPVDVEWHRTYQVLSDTEDQEGYDRLIKEYQDRSQRHPEDGRMLYLYARLIKDPERQNELMKQASILAPDSYRPDYALAYHASSMGDWETCLAHLDEADKRSAPEMATSVLRHAAMIGCGRADELVGRYLAKYQPAARDLSTMYSIIEALKFAGRDEDIPKEFTAWQNALTDRQREKGVESIADVKLLVEMMQDDRQAMEQSLKARSGSMQLLQQLPWRLYLKQPEIVANTRRVDTQIADGWMQLCLAIGLQLHGDLELAQKWYQTAAQSLKTGASSDRSAARMLESSEAPTEQQIRESSVPHTNQGLLLSALLLKFPDTRDRLLPILEKLDVHRATVYHVIHQTIESVKLASEAAKS